MNHRTIKEVPWAQAGMDPKLRELLALLEEIHPCGQEYLAGRDSLAVTYQIRLNLFSFLGKFPIRKKVRILGLPLSLCQEGYFGDFQEVQGMVREHPGLLVILNARENLGSKNRTLSNFVFDNDYEDWEDYFLALRSSYRRRIQQALDRRALLTIRPMQDREDFSKEHYQLYLEVLARSRYPLECLPMEFFRRWEADLYEFRDKASGRLLAFIQVDWFNGMLNFLFCGFRQEDNAKYDLYYNMLIKILEIGLAEQAPKINFGQTSEESKLKIGCREEARYLCVHHSRPWIHRLIQRGLPLFSYRPPQQKYRVFKQKEDEVE